MQWIPSEQKEQPEQEQEFFVVKHYSADERPTIKGNGFDGLEVGTDREDAEKFIKWVNARISTPPQPKPKQEPVVFFKTDNGWRKEEFEKTLVKKVPLDTTPPKPHVWFDFSNVPLDATPLQRKEALSQMAGFYAGKNKDAPQPKPEQELVAWRNAAIRVGEDLCSVGPFGYYDMTAKQWLDWALSVVTVHAPPPQRTWFGLTEEERDHLEGLHLYAARNQVEAWIEGVPAFIDAIEAKLREKNSG